MSVSPHTSGRSSPPSVPLCPGGRLGHAQALPEEPGRL